MTLRIFLIGITIFISNLVFSQASPLIVNNEDFPSATADYLIATASEKPDYTGSLIINKLDGKKCFCHHRRILEDSSYLVPSRKLQADVEALYFPYLQDYKVRGRIFKMILYVSIEDIQECYFDLNIYSNINDRPGERLFSKSVKMQTHLNGEQFATLNMVDYNFKVPTEGMFIAIETPKIAKNAVSIYKTNNDSLPIHLAGKIPDKNGYITTLHYPYLNYMATKDLETAFHIKNNNEWQRVKTQRIFKRKPKYAKPAISLVMTK